MRVLWIVSRACDDWRHVCSSFSSEEFRACVRTVEREDALGTTGMGCASADCAADGWSWESRSANERSGSSVPVTSGLAGSPPANTRAFESS
jgi:hypothetical protein